MVRNGMTAWLPLGAVAALLILGSAVADEIIDEIQIATLGEVESADLALIEDYADQPA